MLHAGKHALDVGRGHAGLPSCLSRIPATPLIGH